jgi:hypothetical protein
MPSAPAKNITIKDNDPLTVKSCTSGYRIMRGRRQAFVFVRNSEVLNLADQLVDAHEQREKEQ